ncbi:MAG: HK97 family phage prohead protease [Bacillota bacterium]
MTIDPSKLKEQDLNMKVLRFSTITDLVTSENGEEYVIEGYAILFEESTTIGNYFTESIARGAVSDDALEDVLFFVNHDSNKITLARSRKNNENSSLQLKVDDKGLYFRTVLDVKNNPDAAALYSAIKRNDVDGMSFWMRVQKDEWDDLQSEMPKRKIIKISKIFEISAVNWPAYENTEIYARQVSDSLDNEKKALESARSALLVNNDSLELAKRKALFEIQKNQGGFKV